MRRGEPTDRLRDITTAGRTLLGGVGYRRTRMADVAAAAGLSSGSVYTYVDSKEALLHLVLTTFFDGASEVPIDLPISAPDLQSTLERVRAGLARDGATPILAAANASSAPADVPAELRAVLGEMYTVVSTLWPVLAVLEKCAEDVPAIQEFYFGGQRSGHLSRFASYVQRRSLEGHLDVMGDSELSAQLAVEVLTWHAWHRLEGFDETRFSDPRSQTVAIDFAVKGLVAGGL